MNEAVFLGALFSKKAFFHTETVLWQANRRQSLLESPSVTLQLWNVTDPAIAIVPRNGKVLFV